MSFMIISSAELRASDSTKVCLYPVKSGSKWGYANIDGRCVIPCSFDSALSFSEGLALIRLNNMWGYIDQTGRIVISTRFLSAQSFSCGLAKVWSNDSRFPTVFIYTNGKIAFKSTYRGVSSFKFYRARVIIRNKICYLDRTGKIVIHTSYPYGGEFYDGIAQIWTAHTAKFIDTNGKRIAFFFEMGHFDFSEGTASVLGNSHPFYLSGSGERIAIKSRSFYINKSGNPVLTNTIDSLVYFPFSDGMAEVCVPGAGHKSGFIDSKGNIVIPLIYDDVTPFSNEFALVWKAGKSYIIDKKGNICKDKDSKSYSIDCLCKQL